ncbi:MULTISPECIES: glutathione S-transferase family protein [Lonsdalea]|uniref:Glutathione S-transferase n=2 Tax=Lonsdalea TaxID=1082702 RepID=A0ACD1JDC3_9GAMM|nr:MULTISPECIES: glutathione S-transferase family protein [Lonsdalea]OSM96898.1 glutathione S-transferase [Lonsdalea populi]RAT12613.1 glutathione S-transferase [Lonsdalea quercina]RAT14395.1 glutathione S-transferase [Lonsdalea quercina]RAT20983.1 glutathione S-transferase [Lonsdalea populi]RAT23070.1 glutathione S-transferase [Lonsdalea populi]
MYQLYIANKNYSSWSLRPWVLLQELNIPFEETLVPFSPGISQPAFKTFSPSGKVPCLVDGDLTVWDSLAITEYLAERHADVWPGDAAARAWARCASAEMHSGFSTLREVCGMNCGIRVTLHEITPALQRDLERLNQLWEEGLTRFEGPFLAGAQFSAVDAFYAPVVFRIRTYGLPLTPLATQYYTTLLALPAMQQWLEQAQLEPWREQEHEATWEKYGTLEQDERTVD